MIQSGIGSRKIRISKKSLNHLQTSLFKLKFVIYKTKTRL